MSLFNPEKPLGSYLRCRLPVTTQNQGAVIVEFFFHEREKKAFIDNPFSDNLPDPRRKLSLPVFRDTLRRFVDNALANGYIDYTEDKLLRSYLSFFCGVTVTFLRIAVPKTETEIRPGKKPYRLMYAAPTTSEFIRSWTDSEAVEKALKLCRCINKGRGYYYEDEEGLKIHATKFFPDTGISIEVRHRRHHERGVLSLAMNVDEMLLNRNGHSCDYIPDQLRFQSFVRDVKEVEVPYFRHYLKVIAKGFDAPGNFDDFAYLHRRIFGIEFI